MFDKSDTQVITAREPSFEGFLRRHTSSFAPARTIGFCKTPHESLPDAAPESLKRLGQVSQELYDLYRRMCVGFVEPNASECSISEPFRVDGEKYTHLKTVNLVLNPAVGEHYIAVMCEHDVSVILDPEDILLFDESQRMRIDNKRSTDTLDLNSIGYLHRHCLIDLQQRPFRLSFSPFSARTDLFLTREEKGMRLIFSRTSGTDGVRAAQMDLYLNEGQELTVYSHRKGQLVRPASTEKEIEEFDSEVNKALRWCTWIADIQNAAFGRSIYPDPRDSNKILVLY